MKGKWFVMYNPPAGYIVARILDTQDVVHSGNLEFYGSYTPDEEACRKTANELNQKES